MKIPFVLFNLNFKKMMCPMHLFCDFRYFSSTNNFDKNSLQFSYGGHQIRMKIFAWPLFAMRHSQEITWPCVEVNYSIFMFSLSAFIFYFFHIV